MTQHTHTTSDGYEQETAWFNYKTNSYDYIKSPTKETARLYIPQGVASQGIYDCQIALGDSWQDAMIAVLEANLGIGKL